MTNDHGVPFVSPFADAILVDGVYQTTACLNDARRDRELRDLALAAIVFELGAEQLRLGALERVPNFQKEFAA